DTTDVGSRGVVVSDSSLKELARAVAVLAGTVRTVVTETANKPEVRVAAIQLAGRAVAVAHQALTSNVGELERLLAEASRVLADVERTQREKIVKP
ncbi:MAG: hypothetical protein H0W68_07820, partial [Gemmatimonadaceae bacterium]|nr:hypothetical protein [Gemmatimonadaceae bacterium]